MEFQRDICINPELRDLVEVLTITGSEEYAKTLGLKWNTTADHFRLTISILPSPSPAIITKRVLVLGWSSPTVIKMKILLQRLWETKLEWDDPVPSFIQDIWLQWNSELHFFSDCHVPRYYFPKNVSIAKYQLHGFSDASENAYSAVIYIRGEDTEGNFHVGLVLAKTKVSPIKRLTIPRLEFCGAHLLSQLIEHVREIHDLPLANLFAWTDSTIVLNWLKGSSRRFKTFVRNRVSTIVHNTPPKCWNHVWSLENPADCASRGIYPNELLTHDLWWKGPQWLSSARSQWANQPRLNPNQESDEQDELCLVMMHRNQEPIIPIDRYSTFTRFQRVTACALRFVHNCRSRATCKEYTSYLSIDELCRAERYWITICQRDCFQQELSTLQSNKGAKLVKHSLLRLLNPFLDEFGIVRVGGRI